MKLLFVPTPSAAYPYVFRFVGDGVSDYDDCVNPILDWCRAQFGVPKPASERVGFGNERWIHEMFAIYLRDEMDAIELRLRWC